MDFPLISIIIPTYNYAHTLPEAVQSALAQDYPKLEIIILDNASTDHTPAILAQLQSHPNITLIRHPENIGMNANFNFGWSIAKGEYCVFLCADDILLPGFLAEAITYLQCHPMIDLVYSSAALMMADGTLYGPRDSDFPAGYACGELLFPWLLASNGFIMLPTLLISRNIYTTFGEFDADFCGFDYEMMLRWAANGLRVAYVPKIWAAFRIHKDQRSGISRFTRNGAQAFEHCSIIERYLTPGHAPKLQFFEESIKREARRQQSIVLQEGYTDTGALQQTIDHVITLLDHIQVTNTLASVQPKITVIVVSNGNYRCLERSLLALTNQSHDDWEAVVVSQPSIDLTPLCKHLDPQQRIRFLNLTSTQRRGNMLNAALRVAQGNLFCFLRAGNVFGRQHLEAVAQAYRQHGPELMLSNVQLEVISQDQTSITFKHCLPAEKSNASLMVAPTHCLEALSFSRKQLDQRFYFPNIDHLFPEWEYLLHHRGALGSVPNHYVDSDISVLVYSGFPHELLDQHQMLPLFNSVYERYPTTDPSIMRARANYRAILERNIANAPTIMEHADTIQNFYEQIYQTCQESATILR